MCTYEVFNLVCSIMYNVCVKNYCNLGARKNNSNIVWHLNISFKNLLRSRLALINTGGFTCFTAVAPRVPMVEKR